MRRFVVALYLPIYTSSLGVSSTVSTGVLSSFNAASVVGQLTGGPMTDQHPYHLIMIVSTAFCALAAAFLLGFASNLAVVFVFAIAFGLVGNTFPACSPAAYVMLIRLRIQR